MNAEITAEGLAKSGVPPVNQIIRNRGFYVCLEECGMFGSTYLRECTDWDSEFATTTYLNNATYWNTQEDANKAYKAWMAASTGNLAAYHRFANKTPKV